MKKLAEKLAERLMKRVWTPFSALIALDQAGNILDICQFDTMFGNMDIVSQEADRFLLLTNHPEGYEKPYQEDRENYRRIHAMAKGREVCAFICGENTDCVEFEMEDA